MLITTLLEEAVACGNQSPSPASSKAIESIEYYVREKRADDATYKVNYTTSTNLNDLIDNVLKEK